MDEVAEGPVIRRAGEGAINLIYPVHFWSALTRQEGPCLSGSRMRLLELVRPCTFITASVRCFGSSSANSASGAGAKSSTYRG
jgi:hypothetical protein